MSIELPVPESGYLKAKSFGEEPRVLQITAKPEYRDADNPQFGDKDGKEYVYYFKDPEDDTEKQLQSTSVRLAKAFNEAGVDVDDYVSITRKGESFKTEYKVEKVDKNDLPF